MVEGVTNMKGGFYEQLSREMIENSIKNIIFNSEYLAILKDRIAKLSIGNIDQKQLKQVIINHGTNSINALKKTIDFYIENTVKAYKKKIKRKEQNSVKYKKLLVEIAPRIEKIYRKLNT